MEMRRDKNVDMENIADNLICPLIIYKVMYKQKLQPEVTLTISVGH